MKLKNTVPVAVSVIADQPVLKYARATLQITLSPAERRALQAGEELHIPVAVVIDAPKHKPIGVARLRRAARQGGDGPSSRPTD